jgi:hypothetical protein
MGDGQQGKAEELIGVQARIEDAAQLAERGRLEGALLLLLVAVAATSRRRYPRDPKLVAWEKSRVGKRPNHSNKYLSDGQAFKRFLKDEHWRLLKDESPIIQFRESGFPIEDLLYDYLRCNLIHAGGMPQDLHPVQAGDVIMVENPDGTAVGFTKLLLTRLNDVVWRAPENSFAATESEMTVIRERRERLRAQLGID